MGSSGLGVDKFTIEQAASIVGVSAQTIGELCDSGRLASWHVPGAKDKRISAAVLHCYLIDNDIPLTNFPPESIGWMDINAVRVLVVGGEDSRFKLRLAQTGGFKVAFASNCFEAGVLSHHCPPDVVLIKDDFQHAPEVLAGLKDLFKDFAPPIVLFGSGGSADLLGYRGRFGDDSDPIELKIIAGPKRRRCNNVEGAR